MKNRTEMRLLDLSLRQTTFNEVALGYNQEEALNEASRCLNCPTKPCVTKCPVNVDIPKFITQLKNNDVNGAYLTITEMNNLPGVCGRVCPQEKQCESACTLGRKFEPVAIGRLERYAADNNTVESQEQTSENGYKVAIIGSGPAGLSCAGTLRNYGYKVDVFEAIHNFGGVLRYGIPEFRLPKPIVDKEIDSLKKRGITFHKNIVCGKTITISELQTEYDGIFIGTGAGLPKFMNIPGESLNGVFSANEFLTRINLMFSYKTEYDTPSIDVKNVAIVGAGNVAMDAARSAVRLGAENVYLIYRRTRKEMPARLEEIEHAIEEGVILKELLNPCEIVGENGKVSKVVCTKMKLVKDENGGRDIPVETDQTEEIVIDTIVMALGNYPNPLLASSESNLVVDRKGCVVVDENLHTSLDKVYAGGDAVSGAATVILAMGAGKKAALQIDEMIRGNKLQ